MTAYLRVGFLLESALFEENYYSPNNWRVMLIKPQWNCNFISIIRLNFYPTKRKGEKAQGKDIMLNHFNNEFNYLRFAYCISWEIRDMEQDMHIMSWIICKRVSSELSWLISPTFLCYYGFCYGLNWKGADDDDYLGLYNWNSVTKRFTRNHRDNIYIHNFF